MRSVKQSIRKRVKLFGKAIPVWALIAVVCAGAVVAGYAWYSATVGVEVKEPLTFGVNYVGWEESDAVGDKILNGYYNQGSSLTCSVSLYAGESTNGNPMLPEEIKETMPFLTISGTAHTFNSFEIVNDAGAPLTVSFAVVGESDDVYMVVWEYPDLYRKLNGYTVIIDGNDFIMKGIGVVAEEDAVPIDAHEFTVEVFRG